MDESVTHATRSSLLGGAARIFAAEALLVPVGIITLLFLKLAGAWLLIVPAFLLLGEFSATEISRARILLRRGSINPGLEAPSEAS